MLDTSTRFGWRIVSAGGRLRSRCVSQMLNFPTLAQSLVSSNNFFRTGAPPAFREHWAAGDGISRICMHAGTVVIDDNSFAPVRTVPPDPRLARRPHRHLARCTWLIPWSPAASAESREQKRPRSRPRLSRARGLSCEVAPRLSEAWPRRYSTPSVRCGGAMAHGCCLVPPG